MSISRSHFDQIKERWGSYSSWAVWAPLQPDDRPTARIGDISVLDPDANIGLLDTLKTDVVLLGLNASSRDFEPEPFRNFHDPSGNAKDFKLRYALSGTDYEGAFMTDVLEGLPETNSAVVRRFIKTNPPVLQEHFERLDEKLRDLRTADPLVIALGGQAFGLARRHIGRSSRLVQVTHYSHFMGREEYRESLLKVIAKHA